MVECQDVLALLKGIGLTDYKSRVYVALISLGKAGAKEISEITSIACSKVYDALTSLRQRALLKKS